MYKSVIVTAVIAAAVPAAASASAHARWCRQGDPPLYVSGGLTCKLACEVVTDYVNLCHSSSRCRIQLRSPTPRIRREITCKRHGGRYTGTVFCKGPAGSGIWMRFSGLT